MSGITKLGLFWFALHFGVWCGIPRNSLEYHKRVLSAGFLPMWDREIP